ncbi:MAG: glycosyltransferase family 2 protein, partial [Proteobacteria bacterium]|nr:glycosyltransferase family 2 protein [Pseudomonadota bacterium]
MSAHASDTRWAVVVGGTGGDAVDGALAAIVAAARAAGNAVTLVVARARGIAVDPDVAVLASSHGADVECCDIDSPAIHPAFLRATVALYRCLRGRGFAAIVFPDAEGLAFASTVARAAGLAFADAKFAVLATGSARARREARGEFPATLATVATEWIEQRAAERCDVVIAANDDVARWMRAAGWNLRIEPLPAAGAALADALARTSPPNDPAPPARVATAADVTIVVTHHEQPRLLDQNLAALARQTVQGFAVVIVDDGSASAESLQYLDDVGTRYPSLRATIIRQANRYVGAARNAGIRAAGTTFVILLDDDNV